MGNSSSPHPYSQLGQDQQQIIQGSLRIESSGNGDGSLTVDGATTHTGVTVLNGGSDTAGSAPALTPAFANGAAAQLADLTRNYMVYLTVTTSGTATSVTIGHTSAANDLTVMASAPATAGQVISFLLPAGWFAKWAGTTTAIAGQSAQGC